MRKIFSFLVPIVIVIIAIISTDHVLNKKIDDLVINKDLSQIASKYGDFTKDRSVIIKDILAKRGDLFLLGSSEMCIDVPQNSIKMFPVQGANYYVSCFGRGYVQNLQQATALGGTNLKQNQKIAYIVSIQWFDNEDGVNVDKFAANFSDIQFNNFLNNPNISEKNKKYCARRVQELLCAANKYPAEAFYAKLYTSQSFSGKIGKFIMNPYYKISDYLSNIKDKALIYKELKALPDKRFESFEIPEINWEEEDEKLIEESQRSQSTNEFYLNDKFYNDNVKDILDSVKGQLEFEDTTTSKEMEDFKFFLSVCKDLNIEPYIIMPPVNGWYYDYLGLSKKQRDNYYNTIDSLSKKQNLDTLDLRNYEYKKDFLIDVMHLGKEGWLKVSEGIYNHFNEK